MNNFPTLYNFPTSNARMLAMFLLHWGYHLNDRNSNHKYREDHYSSIGKQYGIYKQKVNRVSGESKQYGNYKQRENWSVNGGDSRNYFRAEVHRRWNRD